jgi:xanthine/uracil permease
MSLLYLGVMVLLQIAGYDMISGEVIDLQVLIGTVFASVAGILKIWSQVSR